MASVVQTLMRLWFEPLGGPDQAEAAFRAVYADPVEVNGTALTVSDLVARARAVQATYAGLTVEVVDEVGTADRVVVGFRMRGRHVGPLTTPLGVVPPTGRTVEHRVTDILTLDGAGRISRVWMVADDLGALLQLGAVRLAPPG